MVVPDVAGKNSESRFLVRVAATVLAAIIFGALYLGREVFVPIALAVLLSFVLAPLVRQLQKWLVPRALSVIVVALLAFLLAFGIGRVIATQLADLAGDLPRYQQTMSNKIRSLRRPSAASRPLEQAADVLQDLRKELEKPKAAASQAVPAQPSSPGQDVRPVPVEIHQPPATALESIATVIAPLLHPLTTSGIVIIFVVFILLQREDLRDRVIKLAGSHDIQKTTAALDDAAHRLSRLFLTQLALNSAFGLIIGVGLWLIGVPSPALWGIMAAVLRFVPYVGALIAAIFPLALAMAVDPAWSMLLWTAALFLVVEPTIGHVIEPLVYGHSTGLSPFAVIVSATLWTALWGPVGLIVATPLTICLVVLGRHVEQLRFLDIMLGDRPALSPHELFYQRMLAGDPSEAVDKAEEFLKEKSLVAYYDEVALKGLQLAQTDIARGLLDSARVEKVRESVNELVDDLEDQAIRPVVKGETRDAESAAAIEEVSDDRGLPVLSREHLPLPWQSETPVLCIAERNALDAAAASILAQVLFKHGLPARVEEAEAHASAGLFRLDVSGVIVVCVSRLDTNSLAHMRYTIRRLRRKLPGAIFLAGCWNDTRDPEELKDIVRADVVATTLREAVQRCLEAAVPTAAEAVGDGQPEIREPIPPIAV